MTKNPEQYGETETARRRDDALRRALSTPPKRKPSGKKKKSPRLKRADAKP